MRVLVITNGPSSSSFRVRMQNLFGLLSDRGIETTVVVRPKNWIHRRRVLRLARGFDATILQRKSLDPADARLLRRSSPRLLYDIDDATMLPQRANEWPWARWVRMRRFRATADAADHIVAGNTYLAEFFRKRGRPVTILPSVLDTRRYRTRNHMNPIAGKVVLSWVGTRSTIDYLRAAMPTLHDAALRVPGGLTLRTIADATVESTSAVTVEHAPWSIQAEVDALATADIGLAPTPDGPWTRGKCGFKIVQYMAAGLPVVASPVGLNAELVDHEQNGFHADTSDQWIHAIIRLAIDPALRARLGAAGRCKAERQLDITRAADVWASLLRQPADRVASRPADRVTTDALQ
jgi:glycosyltransferase involved in cell wall biosynthesis